MILAASVYLSTVLARGTSERGATMVEYALLVALIAVALVAAWQFFGEAVDSSARSSASVMQEASSS